MKVLHIVPEINEANGVYQVARMLARESGDEVVALADATSANIVGYSEVWVHGMWLPREWYACRKAIRAGKKLVRMTHGSLSPIYLEKQGKWKKRFVAPIERWLFERTDRVVVTCEEEKKWCQKWGLKNEVEILDLKRFFELGGGEGLCRKSRSTVEDSLHVLYLGRRHPLKGAEFLERAVREIGLGERSRSTKDVKFVVVKGEDAPFRKTNGALAWARATGLIGRMGAEETGGKGVVSISAESIRETLNPRQREKSVSDRVHFAALTKLRELIRESRILEIHPDWLKDDSGRRVPTAGKNPDISICIAYAAFELDGIFYRVRLTLKRYAQTETSKAYAYRVNEIEVVPGTLGGKIAPATYPTDTTSICARILLNGVTKVNGEPLSLSEGNRSVELRIVSDHFGEKLERDWAWCDVLVLPTLSENFGLVVAEALERGKYVITTDGAPAWEPPPPEVKAKGQGEQWRDRLVYLRGYRDGTDSKRVELLKRAVLQFGGIGEE